MKIATNNVQETQDVGEKFAHALSSGAILALSGDLGSGKTTFVQGLAHGLGIKRRIISPTFIIMRRYPLAQLPNSPIAYFYHVDLYRLERNLENEIKNLGLDDIWGKKDTVVAIEWAEKIKDLLPQNTRWIKFDVINDDTRRISYINI